jgi:polar amino acid transport system permease protein
MRMSRYPWLSLPARFYIWLFRGSPVLVQLLLLYFGFPEVFPALVPFITVYSAALIAFSFNEGAYMAEIVRAGITSVDAGQMEAAKSLGMRYALAMRRIILPQAARVIVPPLGNEFNNMLKGTSLASVIGLFELTYTAQVYGSQSFSYFEFVIYPKKLAVSQKTCHAAKLV